MTEGCTEGSPVQGLMRGVWGINDQAIESTNRFVPDCRDDQAVNEAQYRLLLGFAQTQMPPIHRGHEGGRMLYNEFQQEDILSGIRFGVLLLA